MTKSDVVMIDVDDPSVAGALVYWELSGDTHHETLDARIQADLPNLTTRPPAPTPEKALRRALVKVGGKRRLIRPLEGALGWAVVEESADKNNVQHAPLCIVKLGSDARPDITKTADARQPINHIVAEVEAGFDRFVEHMAHEDVSTWLVRVAVRMDAVSMRTAGGFYFIPRTAVADWKLLSGALKAAGSGHQVHMIPALRTQDAIDAVISAVAKEAEVAMEALQEELASDTLTARSLNNRADKCSDLLAKVSRYEALLETSQGALKERIEGLQAELVAAALAKEEGDDKAA